MVHIEVAAGKLWSVHDFTLMPMVYLTFVGGSGGYPRLMFREVDLSDFIDLFCKLLYLFIFSSRFLRLIPLTGTFVSRKKHKHVDHLRPLSNSLKQSAVNMI